MPIFEYRCRNCDTQFEKIKLSGAEKVECPNCKSAEAEKLLSTFAVGIPSLTTAPAENGPCPCGAPRRGMCAE